MTVSSCGPPTQLLTVKEASDKKVPLVKMSQGGVQHDQIEGYQQPITS